MAEIKPKYQRIFNTLNQELIRGKYRRGARFFSENDICKRFGTSRMTAVRVMRMLESGGLIVRHQGKGSFVKYDPKGLAAAGDTVAFIMQTMKYLHPLIEALNILYAKSGINLKLIIQEYNNRDEFDHFKNPAFKRVIFNPSWKPQDILEVYPAALKPFANKLIVVSKKIQRFKGYNIYPNEAEMGRQLVNHFYGQGCQNVGFFCTFFGAHHSTVRLKGMDDTAGTAGREIFRLFVRPDLNAVSKIKEWIENNRIDAVTVGQPQEGLLLKNALEAMGHRVPGDIKMAAFADDGTVNVVGFPLPYLTRPHDRIASIIHEVSTRESGKPREIVIDTPLKTNETHEKTFEPVPVD